MEDLFKKFVNAGVGFVSLTTDRVQKTIDTLVKESKLSEKEGAKIMDELKKNGETKRKELEKQVQGLAAKMMKTVGVAPNAEVEELKRTVKGSAKSASTPAAAGSTKGAAKPAAKAPASKTAAAAKGAVASSTSKAASTVKKAADKTSAAASKTQKSAAGSAGAAKKEENKAAGAASSSSQANS
jgi:polyhydroxyalkanoate synthesis regulator phasin